MEAMIRKLFLGVLALTVIGYGALASAEEPPREGWFTDGLTLEEQATPDTGFTAVIDGQEQEVTLADYEGQVLLVNFWATWCAPCVEEMPALDALQAELGGEDFQVLVISNDRNGLEMVEPFYREHGLDSLGIWLDPRGHLMRALETRGLPTSFVIDREGQVVARAEGAAPWDSNEALALLRWYMD